MVVNVGINVFGPIGRSILHASLKNSDIQVVAINDSFHCLDSMVEYLPCHGRCQSFLPSDGKQFFVDGEALTLLSKRDPTVVPWAKHGVDYVVETSGVLTSGHLPTPIDLEDSPLLVFGTNRPEHQVAHELGDVEDWLISLFTTKSSQDTVNEPNENVWRAGGSPVVNTLPHYIPKGKNGIPNLDGTLLFIRDGSEIYPISKLPIGYDKLKTAIKKASDGSIQSLTGHSPDEPVSIGFAGDPHSSLFDAKVCTNHRLNEIGSGGMFSSPMDLIPQFA